MTFDQRKLLVLAAWIATVSTAGLILAIDKPDLWILVAVVAIVPATAANWLWNAPEATLAELIARSRSTRR